LKPLQREHTCSEKMKHGTTYFNWAVIYTRKMLMKLTTGSNTGTINYSENYTRKGLKVQTVGAISCRKKYLKYLYNISYSYGIHLTLMHKFQVSSNPPRVIIRMVPRRLTYWHLTDRQLTDIKFD
jgi:hypothetical protein